MTQPLALKIQFGHEDNFLSIPLSCFAQPDCFPMATSGFMAQTFTGLRREGGR